MLILQLYLSQLISQSCIVQKDWLVPFLSTFKTAWHVAYCIFYIVWRKWYWCVKWFVKSVKVVEQSLDLLFELGQLNEMKSFLIFFSLSLWFQVFNDLEVYFLEDDVKFVEDLFFYLEENVPWYLFWWRKGRRAGAAFWDAHVWPD